MKIQFITRQGRILSDIRTEKEAVARLAYLNEVEVLTQKVAPTDSGDVRFNYRAEAHALEQALGLAIKRRVVRAAKVRYPAGAMAPSRVLKPR